MSIYSMCISFRKLYKGYEGFPNFQQKKHKKTSPLVRNDAHASRRRQCKDCGTIHLNSYSIGYRIIPSEYGVVLLGNPRNSESLPKFPKTKTQKTKGMAKAIPCNSILYKLLSVVLAILEKEV